jgi:hypothetical protein
VGEAKASTKKEKKRQEREAQRQVHFFVSPLIYILSVLSLYMVLVFSYDHSLLFQEYVVVGRASVLALTISP